MAFTTYFRELFVAAAEAGQVDTFVGTGLQTTFPTPNKDYTEIGNTLQYGITEKFLYTGGFVKNTDDSVTIDTAPLAGTQGVIPAIGVIQIQAYDSSSVEGVSNSNIGYASMWIGDDLNNIQTQYYTSRAGQPGISITFTNLITGANLPDSTWLQMASADANGNALTFQATGTTLYTDKISGFSTISASGASGALTLQVASATGTDYFIPGDYIIVNTGNVTSEIRRISSISYNTLTLSASLNYPHYISEPVFSFAREIKLKMTVPEGFTGNTAQAYYNMIPRIKYNEVQRT